MNKAPSQYKNKITFLQRLVNEFNLRIIRTYRAAGHGKGEVNAMSSFVAKNVLKSDTVTRDGFIDQSEEIADYLTVKNPRH